MYRTPVARVIINCVVAVGIILSLLLAGAAPSDNGHGSVVTMVAV